MTTNQEHELVFALLATAARLTRRLDRALSIVKGISFSEFQLVAAIDSQPGGAVTRVDLAEQVGLTSSGVTRALKPLEKLGYVRTGKDHRDARRSLASLTTAGTELVADARVVVSDTLDELSVLDAMTDEERSRFVAMLRELAIT